MRATVLLAIGFMFFGLALMGAIYLSILQRPDPQRPEELYSTVNTAKIRKGIPVSGERTDTPGTKTPTGTPKPTPFATPEFLLYVERVEAEWPARLEARHSGTIRVSLIGTFEDYLRVEIYGNTAVASTPIPVGTPDADLRLAFGREYEAYAVAHIAGARFDISLASPESQSLDQPRVDWIWNIASDDPGLQGIDVSIEIEWRGVHNLEESLRRQIWRSHLEIEVFQQVVSTGQVSAFSLLSAFLGSGLSIPWIYETLKKRRSEQLQKHKKRR
jgi:hypothetical protein